MFYLPEPPLDFQPLRDYRRLADAQAGQLSPRLRATIRRARGVREAALDLRDGDDVPVAPAPRVQPGGSDPEGLGNAARELLGLPLSAQFAWRDPGTALNGWIDAVSRLDVLVLQAQSIPIDEMRGFSITEDRLPVIVLNGGDFPNARTFTLLHEVAHLLLNAGGVCDVLPRRRPCGPTDEVEVLCNQVAAAALMPASSFRAEAAVLNGAPDGKWDEVVVAGLAARYAVSREAVVRRLYTLGLTNWDYLQAK
jgi:Zn-dependent peptidase ImmA (M78 family)